MTTRTDKAQRAAERKARLMSRVLDRALSPKTTGLDGMAKKLVGSKVGPIAPDPDLDHDEFDVDDDGLRVSAGGGA